MMRKITIVPKIGERLAFHVFTPALLDRLNSESPLELPVMALRRSTTNFSEMMLFDRIECLESSSLDPLFDSPLPGTGGRGVAIMFTEGPVVCHYRGDNLPRIDCNDSRDPKEILSDVISEYNTDTFHRTMKKAA